MLTVKLRIVTYQKFKLALTLEQYKLFEVLFERQKTREITEGEENQGKETPKKVEKKQNRR